MSWSPCDVVESRLKLLLVTEQGQSIRFSETPLRAASRVSGGVRGIRLEKGDSVVTMDVVVPDQDLLVVTTSGFGKRTPVAEFPLQGRGGGGVRALKVSDKTGPVAAAKMVKPGGELLIISAGGLVIRTPVDGISQQGRSAQGVSVMSLRPDDRVVSISYANGNGSAEPHAETSPASRAGAPGSSVGSLASVSRTQPAVENDGETDGRGNGSQE